MSIAIWKTSPMNADTANPIIAPIIGKENCQSKPINRLKIKEVIKAAQAKQVIAVPQEVVKGK